MHMQYIHTPPINILSSSLTRENRGSLIFYYQSALVVTSRFTDLRKAKVVV